MAAFRQFSPVSARESGLDYTSLKSHSSLLTNERINIMLYKLDELSVNTHRTYIPELLSETKALLWQLYKSIRCLIRENWNVRNELKLETKVPGVYTLDVGFEMVDKMLKYCFLYGYTYQRYDKIVEQLDKVEFMLKDIMQYFQYFYRPEFKQKPDIDMATEQYKEMADKMTIEQLKTVVGKDNKIDFENLGIIKSEDTELDEPGEIEMDE